MKIKHLIKTVSAAFSLTICAMTATTVLPTEFTPDFLTYDSISITAEAAVSITYLDRWTVAVGNVIYDINETTMTARVQGGYGNMTNIKIPGQINLGSKGIFKVIHISPRAFKDNKSVCTVDLSGAYNLGSILEDAFNGATNLTKVTLGNAVTSISTRAFMGCTKLKTFNTNGNNKIWRISFDAFRNCTSLSSITIPQSCEKIDARAFENSGLTSITIPNDVTSIDARAFCNCKKLQTVTFQAGASNGPGLKIGGNAFLNDTALRNVYFDRKAIDASIDSFAECYQKNADGTYISFNSYGYGQRDYCTSIYKKLLSQWKLKYSTSDSQAQQTDFFIKLGEHLGGTASQAGYMVRGNFAPQALDGMAATVISARKGTCGGFSRVYYDMCLQAGVPESRVLFAGDSHCHAWNYVKCGNEWYNIDSSNKIGLCGNAAFKTAMGWTTNESAHNPNNWYASVDNYIGSYDADGYVAPYTDKFNNILASGSARGISFTGTRVN